jgi:hypothetical protein
VTPIGQHNPTRTHKTVGFAQKKGQKYRFFISLEKPDFLDAHCVLLCTRKFYMVPLLKNIPL